MSDSDSSLEYELWETEQRERSANFMARLYGKDQYKIGVALKRSSSKYKTPKVYWFRQAVIQDLPGFSSDLLATTKRVDGFPRVKTTKKLIQVLKTYQTVVTKNVPIHPSYWHQLHQAFGLTKRIPLQTFLEGDNSLFYEKEFRLNWKTTDNKLILNFGKKHQVLDPKIFTDLPLDFEPGLLEAFIDEFNDMWTVLRMRHESSFNDPKGSCIITWNCYAQDKQ